MITLLGESQLIESYMQMGKFDYVKKHYKQKLKQLTVTELDLATSSFDRQALTPVLIDMERCSADHNLRQIEQRSNDNLNYSDEIQFCFNNFEYPSEVPIATQHDIF